MMMSEKLTQRTSPSSSNGRLVFLVLVAGLAVAMALSMAFSGHAEAKKKNNKKKTHTQHAIAAPGTTFKPPPTNAYLGESVVRTWGYNENGQLGDGTTTNRNTPIQVSNLSGVQSLAGGYTHSLALKTDGTVWAWGNNYSGQLGNGTNTSSNTPVQVSDVSGVKAIAGGDQHSLALKSDGTVWAWGANYEGQLGDGTTTNRNTPVQVGNVPLTNAPPTNAASFSTTTPVQGNNLSGVKAIAGGGEHSLALKEDGTVWAWGDNYSGELGDGTTGNIRNTPVQVRNLSGVKAIAGGWDHSLALKTDGTVWAWGRNEEGQLGNGTSGYSSSSNTPVQVSNVPLTNAPPTNAASFSTTTPVWGNNLSGVKAIAGGFRHSVALKEDGTVWAWGDNSSGELGDGSTTNRNTPVKVSNLSGVMAVSSGNYHILALKSDSTVWAWGENNNSELGDGTTTERHTPVKVLNQGNVTAITANSHHSLAIALKPPVAQQ